MPRNLRVCPANIPVHVIQRGNNRKVMFRANRDQSAYTSWLEEGAERHGVAIHAWVLMTDHVHLLLTPACSSGVSSLMQSLGRRYVRYFNFRYQRSGTLLEGRFRSSLVRNDRYLLSCLRYIELNPVRAGLVARPGDYHWSSYRAHAQGTQASMWTPHAVYLALGQTPERRQSRYRALVQEPIEQQVIARIRHCGQTGLTLGSESGARVGKPTLAPDSDPSAYSGT